MVTGRIYLLLPNLSPRCLTHNRTAYPSQLLIAPEEILRSTHKARLSPLLPFRETYIYPCQSLRSRESIAIA
jgi:hypothetical protein